MCIYMYICKYNGEISLWNWEAVGWNMKPYLHWCFAEEAILYFEMPQNEVQRKYEVDYILLVGRG